MSGIINAPTGDASPDQGGQAGSGGGLSNPLLQQAEQKIEANMQPDVRAAYMKVVVAGMSVALAKGPDGFMGKLRQSQDPISDCARGAVSLMLIMRKEAKGVMPMKAGIPAAMTLLFHGLDFLDRAKIAKIAEPEIDRATTIFTNTLFQRLGITPQMLQHAVGRTHQIMQDPTAMAAINLKLGATRHPDAAAPTPLPPGGMINGGAGETQ